MTDLEERVERLEDDPVEIKVGIKDLLIELKVLMARGQIPLANQSQENRGPASTLAVAPTTLT